MTKPIYNAIHTETTKQIIQKFKKKKIGMTCESRVKMICINSFQKKKNQQQNKIDN